ncbi:MAG TPA: NAD-dependent epimerase/dehydratase family protein [Aromatoleum sp.]|uniref:NAD-dependent epimerase/dehydratase family protein n=1 Tax=Aromatoleum sp. TaxID=2307007 RepID=UPI002B49A934|nr:NAD-dependent epimerase/dehydratase family protein [Aromatoleum sp.]HJV26692.1 NAD-dependent epimerase/dehydratase family protein [Aromatoleum sp.]
MTATDPLFEQEIDAVVRRFDTGWDTLRGARLFITGGTGYFGRWLLPLLARADETLGLDLQVTALSRAPERFLAEVPDLEKHPSIAFHRGDVRDFEFPAGEFTHVIHAATTAAAATFHRTEDPLTKFDTSYYGTRRTLEFAAERRIGRMLMLSSGSYYGPLLPEYDSYPENYPAAPEPTNLEVSVGHAKRAAEFLCSAFADRHNLSFSTARCFTFLGPHLPLDLHYAAGNFIRDALHGDAITVAGDGTPIRSYMYTGDLMVWLLALLTRGQNGRAYNVGSDEPVTIGDLARRIGHLVAPQKPVRILRQVEGPVTRNVYVPEVRRARTELGLDFWTSLDESILRTAEIAAKTAN